MASGAIKLDIEIGRWASPSVAPNLEPIDHQAVEEAVSKYVEMDTEERITFVHSCAMRCPVFWLQVWKAIDHRYKVSKVAEDLLRNKLEHCHKYLMENTDGDETHREDARRHHSRLMQHFHTARGYKRKLAGSIEEAYEERQRTRMRVPQL
jgi:hypothetical protein